MILLRPRATEEIVVGESLQSSRLTDRQRAALCWIRMNEVVTILRDVAGHRCRRAVSCLSTETVGESTCRPIAMRGLKKGWELLQLWCSTKDFGPSGGKHISAKVVSDVATGFVLKGDL